MPDPYGVRCASYGSPARTFGSNSPARQCDWVEISGDGLTCVLPGVERGISVARKGNQTVIKGDFPCIIRSGARTLFSRAIEATFPFQVKVGAGQLDELVLGNRRWGAQTLDKLVNISGSIQFSEYFGTPAALALGLVIEDRDRKQNVTCQFRLDAQRHLWPVFERLFHPVRSDQVLRPLRFLIRADRFDRAGETWALQQQPSLDLLDKGWQGLQPMWRPSWIVSVSDVPTPVVAQSILEQDTTAFGEMVQGLEGNQPLTALPSLGALAGAPLWKLTVSVRTRSGWSSRIDWPDLQLSPRAIYPDLSSRPASQPGRPETPPANVLVGFPKIRTHDGSPVSFWGYFTGPVSQNPDFLARAYAPAPSCLGFEITQTSARDGTVPQDVRMGALDFTVATNADSTPQRSNFNIQFLTLPEKQPTPDRFPAVEFTATVTLPIRSFRIEGQDDPPNDTGAEGVCGPEATFDPPVMIPMRSQRPAQPISASPEIPLVLKIEEQATLATKHQVRMRLVRNSLGEGATTSDVVVIDRFPFLLARVEFTDFMNRRSGITNEIAIWSRDNSAGGWKYDSTSGASFHLSLQSQGVGEQMLKRMEFLDNQLADYRLAPPAMLTLTASSERARNASGTSFDELPSNLGRVLGYVGQRNPGAFMSNARFEMAYGMQTDVTWPLRIAELGSRLGAMPDQIVCTTLETDQTQPIFKYQQYWSALYRRHRSRLAVLQAWDPQLKADPADTGNPIQGYSVGELTTDQGLTFTLRKSADVADPFDSGAAGLNGGVEWGAEFRATYQALQRNPVTPTGELRGLYFSSLGAYGYQKAAFANKKVVISTNVAMGDTFYYAIEEVGKIGCFWNKAKHVVVYERTVWPTLQFAGEQTNHYRQPIIRKILEYCEITQARRNYPDYSGADHPPFKRGFLLSCVFPQDRDPREQPVGPRYHGQLEAAGPALLGI